MRTPILEPIRWSETAQDRLNAHRVLLARAREGFCIYLPRGSTDDGTRGPAEFDPITGALRVVGCMDLGDEDGR